MSARAALKAATAAAHDRVDAGFAGYDLTDRDSYADFLSGHAAAFIPLEEALADAGAERLVAGWSAQRRSAMLIDDLAALGRSPPPRLAVPMFTGDWAILGGLYVLEGSRMGGAVLVRQVAPGLPVAFLGARPERGHWPAFVARLDEMVKSPQALDAATTAALSSFAVFERAVTRSG